MQNWGALQLGFPPGLPRLPLSIPQQSPQNLAACTLGNDINELDSTLQPLVPCLVLLHPQRNLPDSFLVGNILEIGRLNDVRLRNFAGMVVGDLDYRTI